MGNIILVYALLVDFAVLLQNTGMHKIGRTPKRKRKLNYDHPDNAVVVSCFDTPKKITPKQRERRVFVGCPGDKDWDRRMEGFAGVAATKEECRPTPDGDCPPVDIDWASENEDDRPEVQEVTSSLQQCSRDTIGVKEFSTSACSSKAWHCGRSTSAFGRRAFIKTAGSGRTPTGRGRGGGKMPRGNRRAAVPQCVQQEPLDVSISDYDSDTGEEGDEVDKVTNDQDVILTSNSQSPVIASLTPSTSPSPSSDATANKSKISDWVKCLQRQYTTPEKQTDAIEESNVIDSTKKKPKYIRHGLADQLQRLITREKSAVAFWLHKLTTAARATAVTVPVTTTTAAAVTEWTTTLSSTHTTAPTTVVAAMTAVTTATTALIVTTATTETVASTAATDAQDSKVLSLRVVKIKKECSLLVAECSYLPSASAHRDHDNVVVLFSSSSKVTRGCGVHIHPPWQSLDSEGRKVILCAHFHKVFQFEEPSLSLHNLSLIQLASWKCPCEQDKTLNPAACPAVHVPCSTAAATGKNNSCDDISSWSNAPTSVSTMHTDHSHKLVAVSGCEMVSHCGPCLSILDSVEKQGGGMTASIGFTATIQRVFTQCTSGQLGTLPAAVTTSWSLLVQDVYGAVCHIEVTDRLADKATWKEMLDSGEGKPYTFAGLRLVRRTSRARCFGLFSIIDAIWMPTPTLRREDVSQDSSVGSEPATFTEPPGFCYHLVAMSPESSCSVSPVTPQTPTLYNPVCHTPLVTLGDTHGRVMLLARVLCHKDDIICPSIDGIQSIIYVTDASWENAGEGRYVQVMVKQTCRLLTCPWLDAGAGVVVFKDLLCHQAGRCYFDPYSRVYNATKEDTLVQFSLGADDVTAVAMATFSPPPMALGVQVNNLVKVKGHVTSIDVSTAFSWLECDTCHSDKLVAENGSRGTLLCGNCKMSVEQPIARINMDVFVSCLELQDGTVKVKLQQPTIEMLLPKHKDEEGYDMENVLGKGLGPLTCVVVTVTSRRGSCQYVLQEVTSRTHQVI